MEIIGREKERYILTKCEESNKPEFITLQYMEEDE